MINVNWYYLAIDQLHKRTPLQIQLSYVKHLTCYCVFGSSLVSLLDKDNSNSEQLRLTSYNREL